MDRDLFASFVCSFSFWQKYIVCFLSPPAPFIRPIAAAVASLSSSHSLSLSPPIYHTHTRFPCASFSFSLFLLLRSFSLSPLPLLSHKGGFPMLPNKDVPRCLRGDLDSRVGRGGGSGARSRGTDDDDDDNGPLSVPNAICG